MVACLSQMMQQELAYYRQARPDLVGLLDALAAMFQAEQELRTRIPPMLQIEANEVQARLCNGVPIVNGQALPIDQSLFREGLESFARVAERHGGFRGSLPALMSCPELRPGNIGQIIEGLLHGEEDGIERLATTACVDVSVMTYLLSSVLTTFYSAEAARFEKCLPPEWGKGLCPFCGNWPRLARLDGDGQRRLHCSLCRVEWVFPRVTCPLCGSTDQGSVHYLYLEDDRGHRADLCSTCRRYVKTCDERILGRETVLAVEDAITSLLDSAALEDGYV